ncbi:MAG: PrgI family protein [bacterium]|nr:PrgI family protein [bacterium]
MKYQTPQFIDIEDRLFGPLTVKQFVYLVGGAGLSFIAYRFLTFFIAILVIAPVVALSLALAFWKINGKPFVFILESAIRYYFSEKLYLWRKIPNAPRAENATKISDTPMMPKLTEGKLKDLTWTLDISHTTTRK